METKIAIKRAINEEAYSLKGLIDYLKHEGYEEKHITEEIKKINVDWRKNAYLKAVERKEYNLEEIEQLEDYLVNLGFTYEEIKYTLEKIKDYQILP